MAIHEAMCFVETAFKDNPTSPDHDTIPTAVFSQPEIGTVGLAEEDAAKQFPRLEIYRASFRPMRTAFVGRPDRMMMKLVVDAATRVVVGAHLLGPEAGEMAQLIGIAVKARLTKDDFDRTMALHPTAAEELVTMYKPSYGSRTAKEWGEGRRGDGYYCANSPILISVPSSNQPINCGHSVCEKRERKKPRWPIGAPPSAGDNHRVWTGALV